MTLLRQSIIALTLAALVAGSARGASPTAGSVDYWISQLDVADPVAREAAARGLQLSGRAAIGALDDLVAALGDPAPGVRAAACEALGGLGADAAPAARALATLLADDADAEVRKAAAKALSHVGAGADAGRAVPELLRALSAERDDARASAAEILGRLGVPPPGVTPALESTLLRDRSPKVRTAARAALERLGRTEVQLAPFFIAALDDGDPWIRERAASWLSDAPEVATAAVPRLVHLAIADPGQDVRAAAFDALSALGEAAAGGSSLLIVELKHDENARRARAAKILGRIGAGSDAEVKALTEALAFDGQILVRQAARAALVRLARSHAFVVMDLARLLDSDDENMAREGAETLGVIGDEAGAAAEALGRSATAAAEPVRHASVVSLGRLGRSAESQLPQLKEALRDPSERVRASARRATEAIERDIERHPER